jgi:hypothetical protein
MERVVKLNSAQVEQTVPQFEVVAIADDDTHADSAASLNSEAALATLVANPRSRTVRAGISTLAQPLESHRGL